MPNPIALYDDNTSIQDVGRFITEYKARQNAFLEALVNRIGMVLVTSKAWNNRFAKYKRGYMDLGETVEEVFVNIAKPFSYNPEEAEETWMKRVLPDVRAAFHTMNYQKFYKVTIQRNDISKAFLSWSNVNELISYIVQSLYTGMEYDEYVTTRYMIARNILNGFFHMEEVTAPTDEASIKKVIEQLRTNAQLLPILRSNYNFAGVMNSTPVERQEVMISAALNAKTDVDVLAKAFNMERTDFIGRLEVVESFRPNPDEVKRLDELFSNNPDYEPFTQAELQNLDKVVSLVFDRDIFMIFDNLNEMDSTPNGEGIYWQYWLHAWRTYSLSPFANAYCLYAGTSVVNNVAVNPGSANLTQGADLVLNATVTGKGIYDKSVTWSIEPGGDYQLQSGTYIDALNGRLHVSKDEEADHEIIVTAQGNGAKGQATITVKEA